MINTVRRFSFFPLLLLAVVGAFLYLFSRRSTPTTGEPTGGTAITVPAEKASDTPLKTPVVRAAVPAKDDAEGSKGPGVIRGIVLTDEGAPARGARIRLWKKAVSAATGRTGISKLHETTADDEGAFRVEGLEYARYAVRADLGERSCAESHVMSSNYPELDLRLVLRATGEIAGTVVNEEKVPLDGAIVAPYALDGERSLAAEKARALACETSEDGRFALSGIEPGDWRLYVTRPGFAPTLTKSLATGTRDNTVVLSQGMALTGRIVDNATNQPLEGVWITAAPSDMDTEPASAMSEAGGAFRFDAVAPGEYTIDIDSAPWVLVGGQASTYLSPKLPVRPLELRAATGGTLRGRVVDRGTRTGVASVTVSASLIDSRKYFRSGPSDDTGAFEITGLPEGQYRITAITNDPFLDMKRRANQSVVQVQLGRDTEGVEIAIDQGISVRGIVVDAQERPAPGAIISGTASAWRGQTSSEVDGSFMFTGLPAGQKITLFASTTSAVAPPLGPLAVSDSGLNDLRLTLELNADCIAAGILVNASGAPFPAHLQANCTDRPFPSRPGTGDSGKDGKFVLTSLTAGNYEIFARPASGSQLSVQQLVGTLSLSPGQVLTGLRLVYPGNAALSISGTVTDDAGQPLVANVFYTNIQDPRIANVRTTKEGRFEIRGLEPGDFDLDAESNGARSERIRVSAGASNVALVIETLGTLEGAVTDEQGNAISSFELAAVPENSSGPVAEVLSRLKGYSDPDGHFRLGLRPHTYTIIVRASGFGTVRVENVRVQRNSPPASLSIVLPPVEYESQASP